MNRPRKKDRDLPQCVYFKHGAYYYVKSGIWEPLGRDRDKAKAKWGLKFAGPPGHMPELISKALQQITRGVKPSTVKQYQTAGRKLSKMMAEFRPQDVTHATVSKIRMDLADTPNMANRCITVLRMVFHYATENEIVTTNPVIGARRYTEVKRKRLLTLDELMAVYTAAGPRLRVIIDLAIRTGQRIGDVLKIHRSDLLANGIRFEQQKTGAKIIVPWTDELRGVVAAAKALHQNIKALTLLHNRRGKTPDYRTVRDQWERACKAAKVENAHLHDLRAMSATWAKRQGLNATLLLGHTNVTQTERYLRDRDDTVAAGPSFGQSKNLLDSSK